MKVSKIFLRAVCGLFVLGIALSCLFNIFPDRAAIVNFLIYCGAAAFLYMVSRVLMYFCENYADKGIRYTRYRIFSFLQLLLTVLSFPVSIPLLCIEDKFEQMYLSWHERDVKACKEIVQELYWAMARGDRATADSLYDEYFRS